MTWVRIDDEFPTHPKILSVNPLAALLQVRACCYCSQNLTDGFLPAAALPLLLVGFDRLTVDGQPAHQLDWPTIMTNARHPAATSTPHSRQAFGLWEPVAGGWLVHDYLVYNPARLEVLEARRRQSDRSRLGGLSRARKAQRQRGRYVKHQPDTSQAAGRPAGTIGQTNHQPDDQPEHQPLTSRAAGKAHQPVTSRKPATAPSPSPTEEKAQSPSVVPPSSPDGVQPAAGSPDTSDKPDTDGAPAEPGTRPTRSGQDVREDGTRRSEPKALKVILTRTQAARARRLCGALESLPRKVRDFHPWEFLQKCVSQGLPVDESLKILVGMQDRWSRIVDPWAYAAEVLRREYQQYSIDLELQVHERRKREPATVGQILVEAQRKAEKVEPPTDESPWA